MKNYLKIIGLVGAGIALIVLFLILTSKDSDSFSYNTDDLLKEFLQEDNYSETLEVQYIDDNGISSSIDKSVVYESKKSSSYTVTTSRGGEVNGQFFGIYYSRYSSQGQDYIKYNDDAVIDLLGDEIPVEEWLDLGDPNVQEMIPGVSDMKKDFEKESLYSLISAMILESEIDFSNLKVDKSDNNSITYDISGAGELIEVINSKFVGDVELSDGADPKLLFEVSDGKISKLVISYDSGSVVYEVNGYSQQKIESPV